MKNINYRNEIATANQFVINHNNDIDFMKFLRDMEEADITHGDRWSQIYEYMEEHYPGATGSLITGLTYYVEA